MLVALMTEHGTEPFDVVEVPGGIGVGQILTDSKGAVENIVMELPMGLFTIVPRDGAWKFATWDPDKGETGPDDGIHVVVARVVSLAGAHMRLIDAKNGKDIGYVPRPKRFPEKGKVFTAAGVEYIARDVSPFSVVPEIEDTHKQIGTVYVERVA